VLKRVRESKISTSSTGRFLDSVSVLLKVCFERTYEGEPAIKLEAIGSKGRLLDGFEEFIGYGDDGYTVLTTKIIEKVLENIDRSVSDLAFSTQYSLGRSLGEVVRRLAYGTKVDYVVLSGGAVVNSIIVKGLEDLLNNYGIKVYLPRKVPPNDGGIAIGQVVSTYGFNTI
jgi:hydrogenase maturation protein HypF